MKKLRHELSLKLLMFSLLIICFGCASYTPQSFWEVSKIEVDFEANNYKVKKLGVQSTAACSYLFDVADFLNLYARLYGIPLMEDYGIALGDTNLLSKAMKDLHTQTDMIGKPAFLHNINVEWTQTGIPILFRVKRVTITADVIEFTDEYVDYATRK